MKFEEIYIDGFGIFHDYHIKNLTSGLTIFIKPNEAGKSTILSFQKRILFGFPDRRSILNLYPALSGGNHGGRLIVSTIDNKRHTIERYSGGDRDVKVFLPDGSTGGTRELSNLLGDANKDIFENIYAFGLTELQDFETLNSEAVKGRIYSAGTGIGAISLPEVQKNLETEAGSLFKERGSKPEINALSNEIKNVDSRLREIEKDAQNFDEHHKELEEITKVIVNVEQERNQIRTKFNHTTNLITVWDDWRKTQEAEERLQKIPEIENFPENGIEMLERNLEKIDELNENISKKNEGLEKIKIQKSQVKIDEKLLSNEDKILELQKGQDKYISAVRDLPTLEEKLKRDKEGLKGSLHEIGADWDEEKLSKFDISIPTKEIVRKKHNTLEEARENIRDTEKEVQGIEQNIKNIEEEIVDVDKRLRTQLLQQIDEKKLKQQRKSLQFLRVKYPNLKEKEADMRNLEEKEELFTILRPHRAELLPKLPLWPALMFIAAGIASLMLSIFGNNWAIGISILAILSISAIIYVILSRKELPITTPEGFKDKEADLSERREKLESELQKIKSEMLSNAQICKFEDIPDSQLIENKDSELQAASENLLKSNELKKQQETLKQKLGKLSEKGNTIKEKLKALRKEKEKAQKEWKNWLTEKGLESELTPEGTIDIFATIKTCVEKKKSIEETTVRIDSIQEFIEEYKTKISSVLENCNRKKGEINVIVELEKITEELNQAIEDCKTLEQLDIDEENLKLELRTLEEKLEGHQRTVSELLSQGFAESETEFRENARNWEERNKLMDETLQEEQNIKRISGNGKPYFDFINELRETSPEDLKEKELQLKERVEEMKNNLSELREKRGGIDERIKQIERKEEGSSLRVEKTVKMQKLKKKSEEWSILTLARTIMGKAIKKYEQERQPGVIKEAQSFFSKMTLGRYSRVLAPLDEARIYVEDKDGRRKDIQELSRGTAEQLYLSLRFGFIREFSKRSESLPIVFDDILVNFDPERFRAACEAIKELAKTNQILYFTCHPESGDVLTEIIPESKKMR
ncbi:MAG: AAA family ATPase [Methanosarcinales archaeon]|uniref:AAA family ATPase n=1 Tax=Candidatus Ethanoperedens thermophilum TaxID=2766897 RepID=A0A848D8W8_9EURY|nr:AAA family ATPase [Candidatus Ethanoperedens thermophilum]